MDPRMDPYWAPRGPRVSEWLCPHPELSGDTLATPVNIDRYHVHSSKFELRSEHAGCDWSSLCTIEVDDSGPEPMLVRDITKNRSKKKTHFARPWGFVIGREKTHISSRSCAYSALAGRCREWWKIKIVFVARDRNEDLKPHTKYTLDLWSAPEMAVPRAQIDGFAEWAQGEGFEVIYDGLSMGLFYDSGCDT